MFSRMVFFYEPFFEVESEFELFCSEDAFLGPTSSVDAADTSGDEFKLLTGEEFVIVGQAARLSKSESSWEPRF